ncbi:SDR family NAD(P)-dependent oxidoreductase [Arcanobacterium bovis]|uniref:SDR family NAD(P)-dependent oxidoreductase n=1 Tax=Arcanobacterium bovis TaxID=2529275 RepID=A0A4Q9UZ04_9ACTO|nr:SDR family NAD(P)-dependent oxidoreductase [Arcanobacterium bovis]TBW20968.1 SDR family NAD(P)-dependent oxidoreductase [Arcanobacterium bovis]
MAKRALVTGASTGIGAAIVRSLCAAGYDVVATARREDRLRELTDRCGATYVSADFTTDEGIAKISDFISETGPIDVLVNCAGGALGVDSVSDGKVADWQRMYEINVLGTLRVTQLVLPYMRENGGDIVFISSTAGHATYPGGGGYVAAKHAERQIPATLRLELVGEPVRIIDIAPGMVKTEEFSLNRLRGDAQAAEKVYEGVEHPLVAEDVAEAVRWAVSLPVHINIDSMIMRPVAQASNTLVARK